MAIRLSDLTLVNVITGELQPNADVFVEGTRFTAIKPNGKPVEWHEPHAPEIIPCGGLYAIPGLIDAHVHLFEMHEGRDAGTLVRDDIESGVERAVRNIQVALA
ncbi:hypothetical protein LCGC14_2945830, partial [marine sediment metagenome]